MKIDDKDVLSSSLQNIVKTATGANTTRRPESSNTGGTASSDAVELNSNSFFAGALAAGESARTGKIEALRQLYANGQYRIDAQEVSRAIVDAHLAGG